MFVRRVGGGRFTDRRCRGRRPRRPAEVSGGGRYTGGMNPSPTNIPLTAVSREVAERSRPLPTMQKINGRQWQGCGPGMPGPYGVAWTGGGREGQGRGVARPFAVGGWRRKARQSPSGLASSASPSGPDPSVAPRHLPAQRGVTPKRGAFCAGEARERSLPCQREVPSASEAEGFLAVCGGNGQSGKARRSPSGLLRGHLPCKGRLLRAAPEMESTH